MRLAWSGKKCASSFSMMCIGSVLQFYSPEYTHYSFFLVALFFGIIKNNNDVEL